jgi:hypothetical protein
MSASDLGGGAGSGRTTAAKENAADDRERATANGAEMSPQDGSYLPAVESKMSRRWFKEVTLVLSASRLLASGFVAQRSL